MDEAKALDIRPDDIRIPPTIAVLRHPSRFTTMPLARPVGIPNVYRQVRREGWENWVGTVTIKLSPN